ncbi:30S ribosomal protein S13 [Methanospirillum stamsii]|uniref:Small ribosomal subunit protein uS13 n=1 Tax=Methanospirillum stamsii TaxID=1277351 RepID=A0A2V2NGW3_9EURY|nr:30S ribosomal protein S13 [Methanospirillum stamsii]PWR75628.1 30S ribosomal protein S13 [Methanospirillum stamsii]
MAQDEQEINYFVRVNNTDLDGTKPVITSLTGIKGVGRHTAKFIAETASVEKNALMGKLEEASVDRIREVVSNYAERIPVWMSNRPKDIYTGEKRHLLGADVMMTVDDDINLLKKIRAYRGIRHETGQKVRGQRTKSCGRTGLIVGVKRKRV